MQTLIIASQKGGVGKTTTAINLAVIASESKKTVVIDTDPILSVAASLDLKLNTARQTDLGYVFDKVVDDLTLVVPTKSVLESNDFSQWFDRFRQEFSDTEVVIIDTQPYSGERSKAIFGCGDKITAILRADAMTYRTLPPFLKELTESCRGGKPVFAGLLLTLPEEEAIAQKWERALRAQFKTAVLNPSICHDDKINLSLLQNKVIVKAYPNTKIVNCYREIAKGLLLS